MSKFVECDACRSKLGSPALCEGCVWNRWVIEKLEAAIANLKLASKKLDEIDKRLSREYDRRK